MADEGIGGPGPEQDPNDLGAGVQDGGADDENVD